MFTLFQYSLRIQKKKKICTVLLSFLKYNTYRLRKGTKQPLGFFQDHQVRLKTPQAALQNKNLQSSRAGSHLIRPLRICRQPQTWKQKSHALKVSQQRSATEGLNKSTRVAHWNVVEGRKPRLLWTYNSPLAADASLLPARAWVRANSTGQPSPGTSRASPPPRRALHLTAEF